MTLAPRQEATRNGLTVQQALNPANYDGWYAANGRWVNGSTLLRDVPYTEFRARLRGGKGGFGAMLKKEGERMSKKAENESSDAYRNLNGQRVSTINQARAIAKQRSDAKKAKQDQISRKRAKLKAVLNPKVDLKVDTPKFVISKRKPKKKAFNDVL